MAVRSDIRHCALAGLVVGVLALSGCGAASMPGSGTSSPGGASAHSKVALTVTVTNGAAGTAHHWTLRCDPPGGNSPDPSASCTMLRRLKVSTKLPFGPHKHVMCPMIMVSDRQMIVTGTWYGHRVHRVIIDGGCDVALFGSMSKILR